jgi:hypothetical protein
LKGILKWPLIIAAVVVVLRVLVERFGDLTGLTSVDLAGVSNALSVVVLHTFLVPIYIAVRLGGNRVDRPYKTLFKLILIYAVATRAMLLPVYWLARVYQWPESRFYGLADSNPLIGWVALPVGTAVFWIVMSLILGGAIGSATLAIVNSRRRTLPSS